MLHFARWKTWAILATCLAGLLFSLPNFFAKETVNQWPWWLPKKQVPLGLDLQGGAYLLMSMDTNDVRRKWLEGVRDDARGKLRTARVPVAGIGVSGGEVRVQLTKPEDMEAALKELRTIPAQVGSALIGSVGADIDVKRIDATSITLAPTEPGVQDRLTKAIEAAQSTIERRINLSGTAEANVVRQGKDRILVQFPGLSDVESLKRLIGQTGALSFHEVHPSISAETAKQSSVPRGYRIYPSSERGSGELLLSETPVVRGDQLVDAQPGFDSRTNEPVINFRFNTTGARTFGEFTRNNVNRPFAVVLDSGVNVKGERDVTVLTAPVIREPILGGTGQISGSFTVESANALAISLRSGALPATLTFVEERTVGPSLGADSVRAGKVAAIVGTLATIVMTVSAYGTFGVFAVLALFANGLLVLAIMTLMGSTLTLPGIAGLVLTIGMAVDANVLIYERIREELRAGKTAVAAIESGFSRAFVTIADSQLTTLFAAIVMFILGSGPIRGFAVTLSIGIFTSVFTAVTVTRLLAAWWLKGERAKSTKIQVPI